MKQTTLLSVFEVFTSGKLHHTVTSHGRKRPCRACILFWGAMVFFLLYCFSGFTGEASSSFSLSDEGFYSSLNDYPKCFQDIWMATVCIEQRRTPRAESGTTEISHSRGAGFILDIIDNQYAMIVTNSHVIEGQFSSPTMRIGFESEEKIELSEKDDFGYNDNYLNQMVWTDDNAIITSNKTRDLAFIVTTIPHNAKCRKVSICSKECQLKMDEELFSIGFPDLSLRKCWFSAPPNDFLQQKKRLSKGHFLTLQENYLFHRKQWRTRTYIDVIFHSADVLPGNSGGPVFNEHGELVGMNSFMIHDNENNRFTYCAGKRFPRSGAIQFCNVAITAEEIFEEYKTVNPAEYIPSRYCMKKQ